MSKKRSGQENCLLHIPTIHTHFFFPSLFFLYLTNSPPLNPPVGQLTLHSSKIKQVNYKYGFQRCKTGLPSHQQTASSIDTYIYLTLVYNADNLFLYRATNARTGDGAGSVPEFIQKLFRYNVGFEYGCAGKKGHNTREIEQWMGGDSYSRWTMGVKSAWI